MQLTVPNIGPTPSPPYVRMIPQCKHPLWMVRFAHFASSSCSSSQDVFEALLGGDVAAAPEECATFMTDAMKPLPYSPPDDDAQLGLVVQRLAVLDRRTPDLAQVAVQRGLCGGKENMWAREIT